MKVLYIPVLKPPRVIDTDMSLDSLQSLVHGLIACTYPWKEYVGLIHNDNGIAEGLPPNRVVGRNIIFGDFLIAGLGEEDFCGLSDDLIVKFTEEFRYPEFFLFTEDGIVMMKILEEPI